MDKLFVAVLGYARSGKSTTWNTLFGTPVQTGRYVRRLTLYDGKCADVFLVSGSPQERRKYTSEVISDPRAQIVLCSVQYVEEAEETFEYVRENGFDLMVQWLNPGHGGSVRYYDSLGFEPWLIDRQATFSVRDGNRAAYGRAEEIRQHIYGWASARGLTYLCP